MKNCYLVIIATGVGLLLGTAQSDEYTCALPDSVYDYSQPGWMKTGAELSKESGLDLQMLMCEPCLVDRAKKLPGIPCGSHCLNSRFIVSEPDAGSCLPRTYIYIAPSGQLVMKATLARSLEAVSSRILYDVMRECHSDLLVQDPEAKQDAFRVERIGEDEYIFTALCCLVTSRGMVSRRFRVIAAYMKGQNIVINNVGCPGMGERLLQDCDVTENSYREYLLGLYREIYAHAFEQKGTLTEVTPELKQRLVKYQEQAELESFWRSLANLSGWKRALEIERKEHPERFLGRMKDGNIPDEYAAYFHLPELSQEGVFPNINSGVAAGDKPVKDLVKSVYGKKAKVAEVEGGIHANRAEVKVGKDTLFIRVEHLPHRHMAMYRLLECYPGYWRSPHAKSKLAAVRQGRGLVGDFDLWRAPMLDENGIPIKNSGNNLVVFLRGNTLVELRMEELWQPDRDFDLRPLARAIDKLLVEGMRKAGEPLTREQDYLKEEKKQK